MDVWLCMVEQAQAAQARLEPKAGVILQAVWFDAGAGCKQAGSYSPSITWP